MADWDSQFDAVWADAELSDAERIERIDRLAVVWGDNAVALFHRAGARDAAGRGAEAEPLYRRALLLGLDDDHRVRAVIQLARALRGLGRVHEAVWMLGDEHTNHPGSPYRDAVSAFYALSLASAGDSRRAASVAITALAPHVPLYSRSVEQIARDISY
ncbi:tetratricopeptide repeat protein [Humibacter ginsenosidimutans]|uniref:Tetratricopeptide repeat protein n=1 Tax=Humibacter ginsenosidimutans TaxID=2599293 RepID=A0A5B8M033_9MICO|nr:tetratricopeptide repeat protein [Humibacter ginsenosidimutans]QDZ14017.1 tetratricopeptide repeat protein [Humibacter ginsenosidimutans]